MVSGCVKYFIRRTEERRMFWRRDEYEEQIHVLSFDAVAAQKKVIIG